MKLNKTLNPILNQFIGPILFTSIIVGIVVFIYIPTLSKQNRINSLKTEALSSINEFKKIRSYYTANVINDIKNKAPQIKIDFDHMQKEDTIPLPATLLHDLSEILPDNGLKIKLFSHFPFPNRAKRVLDKSEEEALDFIEKNPHDTYVKVVEKDTKKFLKVTVSDIFYDQTCVNCHNSRKDTPKNDWKLGDVRGAIQVTIPFQDEMILTFRQTMIVLGIFIALILMLWIHYTVVSYRQKNLYKDMKKRLIEDISVSTKTLNEYKKAVDSSAIVSKTDKNGKITYVNAEFVKVSGYLEEELVGKNHNIIRHPDMPDEVFKDMWSTIKSKKVWKGQIKNRTKEGKSYYVASTIVPLTNAQDEIEEFLAIRFDISEIVESKIQAEKADVTKSSFLANMSHEIRTPLNAIIGFSQVLSHAKDMSVENKKQASIIESSANSLLMIINDILDISKIESGNFQINIGSTDLYSVNEKVVELFAKKAIEKNIRFIFNMDHRVPPCVETDGTRLRQVISNILSNAIKFTDAYGLIYFNILCLDDTNGNVMIRFEIIDTGLGIKKSKLKEIFQPFIQVDSQVNRKYEGTGLGLSISSHIIETLGSIIQVESKEKEGTRFWFDIEFQKCDEILLQEACFSKDITFAISDKQSDVYHYAKRYLSIFGKLNLGDTYDDSDIVVLCYQANDKSLFSSVRESVQKPKLILTEYEKDVKELIRRSNEVIVSLPFYASKINDAIEELMNGSIELEGEMKKDYSFEGKVLVAEDNLANQELVTYILENTGVEFNIASDGKEAVDLFKNDHYDIVLMDINMPIMDGIEAFKQMRDFEKEHQKSLTPVVALTANAIKGDKEKFLAIGMDEYMSKPIDMDKLGMLFKRFLIQKERKKILKKDSIEISENIQENNIPKEIQKEIQKGMTLNPADIASDLGISENIAKMLITKFKNEIPNDLKELEEFIQKSDFEQIKQKAHFIKNSCLNLGLKEICEDIQQIETEISNSEELNTMFQKIKTELLGIR